MSHNAVFVSGTRTTIRFVLKRVFVGSVWKGQNTSQKSIFAYFAGGLTSCTSVSL